MQLNAYIMNHFVLHYALLHPKWPQRKQNYSVWIVSRLSSLYIVLDDDACDDGNVYDLHIFVSLLQFVDGMIEASLMREDIIVQSKLWKTRLDAIQINLHKIWFP